MDIIKQTTGPININCNVFGTVVIPPVLIVDDGVEYKPAFNEDQSRLKFSLVSSTNGPPSGWGGTVYWDGKEQRVQIPMLPGDYEGGNLEPPFPNFVYDDVPVIPVFSREQICNAKVTLSGLTITTGQFGEQPWFELAWQCLSNKADRDSVLKQKIAAGDTGQVIEFYTREQNIYPDRPNNATWLGQCITQVGEFNQLGFFDFVTEILVAGLVPVVVFDGDNGDNIIDGYPNALRQLPILTQLLSSGDYNSRTLYARFWDGVFYGSSPENIQNFGKQFRKLLRDGHLAIEFNPGHIPVGNGPKDYAPLGMMTDYDVVVAEFNYPNYREDSTWQIVARLVPSYNRPPDQPSWDDPSPPFYLKSGNKRGQYYFWAFELGEYQWVRNEVSLSDLQVAGRYYKAMGCYNVGFPS